MEACFLFLEDFVSDEEYALAQGYDSLLAKRGQLINADSAAFLSYAKEMLTFEKPMQAIRDRCLSLQKVRMEQLNEIRALRQEGKK